MNEEIIEISGRNVEEAIETALKQLATDRDSVEIEVIDEGNKGLLGIIGKQSAKIKVTLKATPTEKVCRFLDKIFVNMGTEIFIHVEDEGEEEDLRIVLGGKDVGVAIGRRGEVLDALQYLASLVYNRNTPDYRRVVVDSENYRQKREDTLKKLAERLAERARRYRKEVILEPMNPYERRIIHSVLQNNKYVRTYSIGEEPSRKVVIVCK